MKKSSTLILKAVLVFMTIAVLALCVFAFPGIGKGMSAEFPAVPYLEYIVIIPYLTVIPFFVALYQAFLLLIYIDKNIAFSESSVKALRKIKYSANTITALWMMAMPFIVMIAEVDDAPGAVPIFFIFACAPLVVSVFSAVLQKLVKNAIDLKSENDLTV